ncbi:putative adenylate/guanylate cyclase [Magnetofaba australis IT-1]|uniref:Putative adenylate/guanylate cyclase n=1 Tax=Magnetofaba australis IT-1 TaxID=1434232 RepID=A0A1Y2K679_9PROT|nr:putative adenylate/guanylate cyclase [Magnetofaba australis IT-1]
MLFADISGFTAMSEKLDPEEVTDLMNGCLKMLADIVVRYEGHVDKFIGDCIMAIFGAPITHENDPELAVRAALDMQKEIEEYNKRLPVKLEKPLSLHIGVNSGMVIAGGVGSDQKMEYTVMGDTVNLASRLESMATGGETYLSVYTYNLCRNHFEFEKLDPIKVKGKKDPVAVYKAIKAKTLTAADRKSANTVTPLVGRARELDTLRGCMDQLLAGNGQAVFLVAPPGIGKSRVQMEIKQRLSEGDVQIIEGICRSFGRTTSYYIFSEIFQHLFNIDSEDMPEAITEKISSGLPLLLNLEPGAATAEARSAMVFIGAILGAHFDEAEFDVPISQMDAQEIKGATFRAIAWFFLEMARSKPLLLVLEDLHHADNSSVELIASLFEQLRNAPIAVLALMRPVKDHPCQKLPMIAQKALGDSATEIEFKSLTPTECDELVRKLIGSDDAPEEILALIRQRADGNPMFIEEIVQSLWDEEVIERASDGAIRLLKEPDQVAIPSSIQGMIIARIDKLQSDLKETLHAAAVIGPVFKHALIQRVSAAPDIEDKLNQVVDMGLIFESKSFPEIEYSFRNIMIQEAIYGTLLHKKQKELHAVVAQQIEDLFENRLEDHYEVLAEHYQLADEPAKAYDYALKSGLKAKEAFANADAQNYLEMAIDIGINLPEPPTPLATVYAALADVQELGGALDNAIAARRKILPLLTEVEAQADILRQIGRTEEKQCAREQAMATYEEARKLLADAPESMSMGNLLVNISWVLGRLKRTDEAIATAEQAMAIFEKQGHKEGVALACNNLGVFHEFQGDLDTALDYNQKSLSIFSGLGDRRQTGNLYLSLGFLYAKRQQGDIALDFFEKSHQIMTRIGNRPGAATALMNKGKCYAQQERFEEAEDALSQALKLHRELNLRGRIIANCWLLFDAQLARGKTKPARDTLELARSLASAQEDTLDLAKTARAEARLLAREGKQPQQKLNAAIKLFLEAGREKDADAVRQDLARYEESGKL